MKKFLIKLFLFIALLIAVDYLVGQIFDGFIYKAKSGIIFNSLYGIEKCDEDILLLGDSEIKHGIISKRIEDSLGLTCYNLGFDGNRIYYQYAILREALERYTPRIIVISTSVVSDKESTIVSLFPFYKKHDHIRETILEVSPVEKYKLISNAYMYNSLILTIIQGLTHSEPETNGYRPLYNGQNNSEFNLKPEPRSILTGSTPRSLAYFEKLIRLALSSGSRVVVINAPKFWFNSLHNKDQGLQEIVSWEQIVYLDYENDSIFTYNPDIFYDGYHLNHNGAELFTNRLISDLKDKISISNGRDSIQEK